MIRWRFEIKMVSHSFKSFKLIPIKECAHASGFIGQPARYLQSLSACVFCRSQYLQHIYHFDRSMMIHCMTTVAIRCIIKVYFFFFFSLTRFQQALDAMSHLCSCHVRQLHGKTFSKITNK